MKAAIPLRKAPTAIFLRMIQAALCVVVAVCPVFAGTATIDVRGANLSTPQNAVIVRENRLLIAADYAAGQFGFELQDRENGAALSIYDHSWTFRTGEADCTFDGQRTPLPVPAQTVDGRLYCPATTLLEPLGGTVYQMEVDTFGIELPRGRISEIRRGPHRTHVRMVVDLTAPVFFSHREEGNRFVIRLPLAPDEEGPDNLLRQLQFDCDLVPILTESHQNGWAQLAFSHSSPNGPEVFTLPDPPRIVIDFTRPVPLEPAQPPEPEPGTHPPEPVLPPPKRIEGVEWTSHNFDTSHGPVKAWSLKTDPTDEEISVQIAMDGETVRGAATVGEFVRTHGAYAGVNGGFYGSRGRPLGMLVLDGEWITAPLHQRAVFGIMEDGSVQIRNVAFDGWVEFEGLGRLPLEGLNTGHRGEDGVVVYTSRWGELLAGNRRKTRVIVCDGVVQAVLCEGEQVAIPLNGYILSGLDRRADSLTRLQLGQAVTLHLKTDPEWPGMVSALGAGPRLLSDGDVALSSYDERFRSDVTYGARPRTAAGVDKTGQLVLLVAEDTNDGLTLGELASVMKKLGCVDAMNLDGGGSSTFVVDGRLMNVPSDGCQRPVGNAILVIDERAQ